MKGKTNITSEKYYRKDFVFWIVKLLNEAYVQLMIEPVTLKELLKDHKEWDKDVEKND